MENICVHRFCDQYGYRCAYKGRLYSSEDCTNCPELLISVSEIIIDPKTSPLPDPKEITNDDLSYNWKPLKPVSCKYYLPCGRCELTKELCNDAAKLELRSDKNA